MAGRGRVAALLLAVVAAACGRGPAPDSAAARDTLTRRERDSIIGASRLPGAAGVRQAIRAGDSAAARNARLDAIGR